MLFETYLHGFQYITAPLGEKSRRFYIVRNVFFGCCIVGAIVLFAYQAYLNISAYLLFEVATAASFQHFAYGSKSTAIDFPAITICPNNMFLADQIGFQEFYNPVSAFILALVEPVADFQGSPSALRNVFTQCNSSLPQMRPDMSSMPGGLGNWLGFAGIAYVLEAISQNSVNSVLGCKWQGKPINCADLFLNRMTDQGGCFTLYPSADYVESFSLLNSSLKAATEAPWFINEVANCWNETYLPAGGGSANIIPECAAFVALAYTRAQAQAFGTSPAQIKQYNLTTSSAGPRSGLQLILNVQPNQYCVGGTQNTLGFFALPHDRNSPPLLQMTPNIEIPAGFVSNIAISIKQIVRDASVESMGKCKSVYPLQWYPTIPTYSYDACLTQYFAMIFINTCGCVPFFAPPYMLQSGENGRKLPLCNPNSLVFGQCYIDIIHGQNYSGLNLPKGTSNMGDLMEISACPTQCRETQYTTAVSFAPLMSPAAFKTMLGDQNVTIPPTIYEFRRTFAMANFYYADVEVMLIHETQAVKIMDVINGMGGSLGLCIGGSFITVVEVIWAIVRCCEKRFITVEEDLTRRIRLRAKSITPITNEDHTSL